MPRHMVHHYTVTLYTKEAQRTDKLEEMMEAMASGPASLAIVEHEKVDAKSVELSHWFKKDGR